VAPWRLLLVAAITLLVANVGLMLVAHLPSKGMRTKVRSFQCLSNAKQLAGAVLLYADNHDDRLPPPSRWLDVALPRLQQSSPPEACPERPADGLSAYAYRRSLGESQLYRLLYPASDALIFEVRGGSPGRTASLTEFVRPHPLANGPRGVVAYADGHARLVADATAPEVR
jgi:prepilin-type processing-associated H-X9-DG protein